MKPESLARLDFFLASAAKDLLASHGVILEEAGFRAEGIEEPYASTIGFTAQGHRGVLVLTASRSLAVQSLPPSLRAGEVPEALIADWTGELSNQILGRIKNHFHDAGIEIALSTPTVFAGKELRHLALASPITRTILLKGEGSLLVEFQADFDEGFEIPEGGAGAGEAPAEGEVLFF